jgi:hypothetical protein
MDFLIAESLEIRPGLLGVTRTGDEDIRNSSHKYLIRMMAQAR